MFVCFLRRVKSGMNWNGKGGGENIRGVGEGKNHSQNVLYKKYLFLFFLYLFYFTENRFSPPIQIHTCSVSL